MTETELYKELAVLTRNKDKWEDSVPYLYTLLDSDSDKIKAKALWLLGESGLAYPHAVKNYIPAIASFLADTNPLLRERAINAIEIQRADHGAGKRRARYHSSAMEVDHLKAGQDFDQLPESYVIFITENDIFSDGKPYHRIERVDIDGDGQQLFNDGEHILYVNGAYRGDSDIGRLMYDFSCWNPDDMNYKLMRDTTRFYKEDPKGVEIVCKAFEEARNDAIYRERIETAKRLIARGKDTLEEIAELTCLTLQEVRELAELRTA